MPPTNAPARFAPGQRITAVRSGSSAVVGVVLEAHAAGTTEVYLVRWADGRETFFVPGPEAQARPEPEPDARQPQRRRSRSGRTTLTPSGGEP